MSGSETFEDKLADIIREAREQNVSNEDLIGYLQAAIDVLEDNGDGGDGEADEAEQ